MEFEQTFEKKLKAYKRKKTEYEMLEEAEIEDEVFRKETVQEIIEALNAKLANSPIYNFSDPMMLEVADLEASYGKSKIEKYKEQAIKKLDAEKKKLDKALLELYHLPKTEGRLVTLLFYSVTRSFAPTSFSCKSVNS